MIDCVIFDCDGTLVDSETITTQVLVEFISEFGLDLDGGEAIGWFAGRDMAGITKMLEKQLCRELPADFVDQFRQRQAVALEKGVTAIPGAVEVLQSINLPVVLASNAPRAKIEINLRVSGLDSFFPEDRIFSAYDNQIWKPEPDLFVSAAAKTGFDPERCLVVEDSGAGFEAAARAGAHLACFLPQPARGVIGPVVCCDSLHSMGARSVRVINELPELIPIIGNA